MSLDISEIVRRLESGESAADVAQALGVSIGDVIEIGAVNHIGDEE